jgi:hypothetical protein
MKREQFEKIMNGESDLNAYEEDNALLGLKIIAKYLPRHGIEGAENDTIYSVSVDKLLKAGLTETDAIELNKLNWMIDERRDCLACFV